jgi:hypothetical protein
VLDLQEARRDLAVANATKTASIGVSVLLEQDAPTSHDELEILRQKLVGLETTLGAEIKQLRAAVANSALEADKLVQKNTLPRRELDEVAHLGPENARLKEIVHAMESQAGEVAAAIAIEMETRGCQSALVGDTTLSTHQRRSSEIR